VKIEYPAYRPGEGLGDERTSGGLALRGSVFEGDPGEGGESSRALVISLEHPLDDSEYGKDRYRLAREIFAAEKTERLAA